MSHQSEHFPQHYGLGTSTFIHLQSAAAVQRSAHREGVLVFVGVIGQMQSVQHLQGAEITNVSHCVFICVCLWSSSSNAGSAKTQPGSGKHACVKCMNAQTCIRPWTLRQWKVPMRVQMFLTADASVPGFWQRRTLSRHMYHSELLLVSGQAACVLLQAVEVVMHHKSSACHGPSGQDSFY